MTQFNLVRLRLGRSYGVAADEKIAAALSIFSDPDSLFSLPDTVILKDSRTTRAAVIEIMVDGRKRKFHLKRLNNRGFIYTLRYLFTPSRARRLFCKSVEAVCRSIPVPLPVAYIEKRFFRILKGSFFITEFIDNTESLFERWQKISLREERLALISSLANFIASLHANGYYQRDMKASNILLINSPEVLRFFVTDLDGAKLFAQLSRKRRIRDLARLSASFLLSASSTDRYRFLHHYLSASKYSQKEIPWFSHKILAKTLKLVRHQIAKKKHGKELEKIMRQFLKTYSKSHP